MNLFAWVTPAFLPGMPLDHTWVTDFDVLASNFPDLNSVKAAARKCWLCWGDFHSTPKNGLLGNKKGNSASACLVTPNEPTTSANGACGTVLWYGIDGVCHQVSNQVLYTTKSPAGGKPETVAGAKGYRLSSTIFGTYGRRKREWELARQKCLVAPPSASVPRPEISLLSRRLSYALDTSINDRRVVEVEERRRESLRELDEQGFRPSTLNETPERRATELNGVIQRFLETVARLIQEEGAYYRVFEVEPGAEVNLIDPKLFVFPSRGDRPQRGQTEGW